MDLRGSHLRLLDVHRDRSKLIVDLDPESAELLVLGPVAFEVIDAERMRQEKGYGPEQAIDVQTLCGDTVDNVPGVRGIGPKTAARWLQQYGSLDAIVAHVAAAARPGDVVLVMSNGGFGGIQGKLGRALAERRS